MNIALPRHMTVDEFLAWAVRQEKGRYELFKGRVVMQQPQTWRHAELRVRIYNLFVAAIEGAGASYFAAPDGMTVRISKDEAFEPDALVAPLPKPEGLDLEIPNPVLVVEVLSPSSVKRDLSDKLAGYFVVPSIEHYLVIDPEEREVIWHRRAARGALEPPAALRDGTLRLDPPGTELRIADVSRPNDTMTASGPRSGSLGQVERRPQRERARIQGETAAWIITRPLRRKEGCSGSSAAARRAPAARPRKLTRGPLAKRWFGWSSAP